MKPLLLTLACLSWAAAEDIVTNAGQFFSGLGKGIKKEVTAVKHPVDTTVFGIAFSQCQNVKKLVGVAYESYEGDKEPDLGELGLEYWAEDQEFRTTYNLSSISELLPTAEWVAPRQDLTLFMHGFTDDPSKTSFQTIRKMYFERGGRNLMALDASSLIKWFYLRSTTFVRFIGRSLGLALAALTERGLNPSKVHLIGHSLGSHISSFAAKTFYEKTGVKLGRITGLDPAGPCFSDLEPGLRLSAADAQYVDVIHTDAGVYGLKDPIGHVDYFPNSGAEQPNCLLQTCSHSRAWELYAESLRTPDAFPAVRCDAWDKFRDGQCSQETSFMGVASPVEARGKYYLQTNEEPPYGRGHKGLKFVNKDGIIRNVGRTLLSGR